MKANTIATFNVDYDCKKSGKATDTVEVIVHPDGTYAVSVLGARGGVKSFRKDFDDVLTRGWVFDHLSGNTQFRNLLADLGVNFYKYLPLRRYYAM